MGSHNRYIGDYVAIEFVSADATTAAAIKLKDANDVTYTLKANERLIVDTMTGSVDPSLTTVTLTVFADINADGNIDANEYQVVFSYVISVFDGGAEGYSFPIGITPKAKASGAGSVRINGTGRVVKGQTEGLRPNWRESLIPGH